jgi:hypothetical protein
MIKKTALKWIPSVVTTLALTGFAGLCHAQSPITYTFDSDVQGWGPLGGGGTYSWDATDGNGGGGCLKVDFDGTTTTEIDPGVTLPAPLNQAQYLSVSVDIKIDPASGTTGVSGSGGYGNLQAVFRDASFSWDSMWYGALFAQASTGWITYTFVIPQPYKSGEQTFQFQLQGNASTGYSAPVTVYIDNVRINPVPNPWVIDAFTNDTSATYANATWTGISSTAQLTTSQDAGGNLIPAGALQWDITFPTDNSWQQCWIGHEPNGFGMDPSRFVYWECDVMVDAANSTANPDGSYGGFAFDIRNGTWGDNITSAITLDSSYTSWKHIKLPLPNITASVGFDIIASGVHAGPVRLYIDNIQMSKPNTLPKMAGLLPGSPNGVKISVDGAGDQWNRQGLCVPVGMDTGSTWVGVTPATYSFTITNFPTAATSPGFESHVYIVNGDTPFSNGSLSDNETSGSVDWNASTLALMRVQNGTNGGVITTFEFKTNSPASNPLTNNVITCVFSNLTTADGTWSLNFTSDTQGNITGPMGVATNFTLPADVVAQFSPSISFVQFGVFKDDAQNSGINDNKGAIFTHVLVTNANTVLFDDNFSTGFTNTYAWRASSAPLTQWIPQGTKYWLKWTVPDAGFTPQLASQITGPWSDAGIQYIYTDATGTNRLGAMINTNLPAGNAAYFRLINTNSP